MTSSETLDPMNPHPSDAGGAGAHTGPPTLESLPIDILRLILEQVDCVSDLAKAVVGCPPLFRTFKRFEAGIILTVFFKKLTLEEIYPLHTTLSLPKHTNMDKGTFDPMLATLKQARQRTTSAEKMAAISATMTFALCRKIDSFHEAQSRLADWYFRDALPGIPADEDDSDDDSYERTKLPTTSERLRFLQAVCNIEIVRKLTGGKFPRWSDETGSVWLDCLQELRSIFSLHDSLQMLTIGHGIRRGMQRYYRAVLNHVSKQDNSDDDENSPENKKLQDLYSLVEERMYDIDIDQETGELLARGLETCVEIMFEPKNPRNFKYLTDTKRVGYVSLELYYHANGGPWSHIEGKGYWGEDKYSLLDSLLTDISEEFLPDTGWIRQQNYQDSFLKLYAHDSAIYLADEERIESIRLSYRPELNIW